jgi:hypothetical protein
MAVVGLETNQNDRNWQLFIIARATQVWGQIRQHTRRNAFKARFHQLSFGSSIQS